MDMYDLREAASEYIVAAAGWVQTHPERTITWGLIGGLAAFVILRQGYQNRRRRSFFKAMGKEMTAEDRKQYLDAKAADAIADFQMEMWNKGGMSWQEVKSQNKRFGIKTKMSDLLPISNHPAAIRHRVMAAIAAMKKTPKQALTAATAVASVTNVVPLAAAKGFKRLRGKSAA